MHLHLIRYQLLKWLLHCYIIHLHTETWWTKLGNIIKLMQPISDAIHQLEADRPLLSQVLGVWHSLIEHAEKWAVGKAVAFTSGIVVKAFQARFATHYQPEMAAACALDPINFTKEGDDHYRLPLEGMDEKQRLDIVATVMRLNGPATSKEAVMAELTELEMGDWDADMIKRAQYLAELRAPDDKDETKIVVATVLQRRRFWLRFKVKYPLITAAANKLLSVHVTTAAAERNWSAWGRTYTNIRNRLGLVTADMMIYIKANYAAKGLTKDELVALTIE